MKKPFFVSVCAIIFVAILGLTACDKGQNLPEPAVDLPVALSSFDVAKYDFDFNLGEYKYEFKMSKEQQADFQELLQADKWFDPGELPGRDYTSVVDAVNGKGWNLTVGYWDEENTIIALYNDDESEKNFYFAPIEVQEEAGKFREKLKQ